MPAWYFMYTQHKQKFESLAYEIWQKIQLFVQYEYLSVE
jgi:hypothetical protein